MISPFAPVNLELLNEMNKFNNQDSFKNKPEEKKKLSHTQSSL